MKKLFDFSALRPGQIIVHVIFDLWAQSAKVLSIKGDTIKCLVEVIDGYSTMSFDRLTGVHCAGPQYGLLVNTEFKDEKDFAEKLKVQLQEIKPGHLLPETAEALHTNLQHNW